MVFIYVLKLQQNKYYVGKTNNPTFRMDDHFNGGGSVWTQKYTPIKLLKVIPNCDDYDEEKYTKIYMDKYGINNVRGGPFTSIKLDDVTIKHLSHTSNSTNNRCFKCGEMGHFARDCTTRCNCDNNTRELGFEGIDEDSDEELDLDSLKTEFLSLCNKEFKGNTEKILSGDTLVKIFKKLGDFDLKLTNIYGLCQTINSIMHLTPIPDYRNGINYLNFIDGFIYIIENNPQICGRCEQEPCCCRNKNSGYNKKYTCYRCGRSGHFADSCYAQKHVKGYYLN